MENIRIPSARNTPGIDFDFSAHRLTMRGESYPEDASAFYQPLLKALEQYLTGGRARTIDFDVYLTYFNSSSTKALFRIFDLLEEASRRGDEVRVNWYYHEDDDNIMEFGQDFREDFEVLTFTLCALPPEAG